MALAIHDESGEVVLKERQALSPRTLSSVTRGSVLVERKLRGILQRLLKERRSLELTVNRLVVVFHESLENSTTEP